MVRPLPSWVVKTTPADELELLSEWVLTPEDAAAALGATIRQVYLWRTRGLKGWLLPARVDLDTAHHPRMRWGDLVEFAERTGRAAPDPARLPPALALHWNLLEVATPDKPATLDTPTKEDQ